MSGETPMRWIDRAREAEAPASDDKTKLIEHDPNKREAILAGKLLAKVEEPVARRGASQRVFRRLESSRSIPERRVLTWALSGAMAGALAMFVMMRGGFFAEAIERPRAESIANVAVLAPSPEIATIDGEVEMLDAGGVRLDVRAGRKLRAGEHVRTGAKSTSSLSAGASAGLAMAPMTELLVASSSDVELEIALLRGAVTAVARADVALPVRLVIVSGSYRVSISSARLEMKHAGDDVEVVVSEGTVELRGPTGPRTLSQGERFSTAKVAAVKTPEPVEVAENELVPAKNDLVPAKNDRIRRTLSVGSKRSHAHKKAAPEVEAAPDPEASDPPSSEPATKENVAPEEVKIESAPVETAANAPSETPAIPKLAPHAPERAPEDDTTAIYNRAKAEQNPMRAIALFDEVARRGGSLAEIAAYQAARLTMNGGRCKEALERFRALIERHPDGSYVQESMLDVLECRIKLNALDAAGGDLEAFLLRYPNSERSPELRFLRAELHRRRGDIQIAAQDYEASLGSRHAADALFFLAWSKVQLKETASARALLGEYLERYPSKIHAGEARKLLERLDRSPKK